MVVIKNDLISIIIPFYKVEEQIERCINSVLSQTYKNIEILCVGSKKEDTSKDIVKKLMADNNNIQLFIQDGIGLGDARNKGLEKSKGKFIIFLDGDDYIKPNAVELLHDKIIKTQSDIVCGGFVRIDDITGKIYSSEMTKIVFEELEINKDTIMEIPFISPAAWGKIYKREIVINEKYNDKPVSAEDLLYFLQIIKKAKKISFIKEELWYYVVRADSLIFNTTIVKAKELCENLLTIRKSYTEEKLNKKYLEMLDLVAFIHLGISMSSRITKDLNTYIKSTKKILNNEFIYWNKVQIRYNKKMTLKTIIITIVRAMFKWNLFKIFIYCYNFMIKKLKIDIKW